MAAKIILGIDEVGRGPWAGPLVVGAVILGAKFPEPNNLADSKKLTAKKRETLSSLLLAHAAATGLGWVSAAELDRFGLSASLKLATRRAVKQILATKVKFSEIIIDGTVNFLENTPLEDKVTVLPKADALIPEVSAASIIAKVARDDYMVKLAEKYSGYGFEKHVGYGTALHREALLEHGICPEHRQSFRPIHKIMAQFNPKNREPALSHRLCTNTSSRIVVGLGRFDSLDEKRPTMRREALVQSSVSKGKFAENAVARYLQAQNHVIIAQNYKTKSYEIDLISVKNDQIFFTEVKSRKNARHGSALAQITSAKQRQMRYAAEKFLSSQSGQNLLTSFNFNPQNLQPLLAVAAVEGEPPMLKTWFTLDF